MGQATKTSYRLHPATTDRANENFRREREKRVIIMPKERITTSDEFKKVIQSIEEYIFQTHKFPSVAEISEAAKLSKMKCAKICDELVKENQLYIVFEGKGLPKIYVPYNMMQGLLMTQRKPEWISKYTFKDETSLRDKAKELNNQLITYDMFKRLLYATDIPLEEAVAFALNWLEFRNVIHHKENPDNPDITFEHEGKKVLVEVEGTTKAGGKSKVLQLEGWMRREIDEGKKTEELQGIFIVNHFRETEPDSRPEPLSSHAKEFLKRYGFKFFTTRFLFEIVKQVASGKISKENARKLVWNGEEIK